MAVSYLYAGDCIVASAESGDASPTRCSCGETRSRAMLAGVQFPPPRGEVKQALPTRCAVEGATCFLSPLLETFLWAGLKIRTKSCLWKIVFNSHVQNHSKNPPKQTPKEIKQALATLGWGT